MKILAIKFKYLGDVAINIPALRALREAHPDAEIHYLVPKGAVDVVKHIPWINKVWGIPRKPFFSQDVLPLLRHLRKEHFDLSIDFVGNDRGALTSLIIGADVRLGPESTRGFVGRKYCYTLRVPEPPETTHEVDRNLKLLERINIAPPSSKEPEIYSDPSLKDYASNMLPKDAIICHLSTSTASKEWPIQNWVQLYQTSPNLKHHMVFTTGTSERELELLEDLKIALPEAKTIEPTPNIPQLIALIDHAAAVVCGDTFTSHVAAGLGTPLVVIFGPTRPEQWDPKGNSIIIEASWCKCRDFFYKCTNIIHCLSQISATEVKGALLKQLKKGKILERETTH